MNKKSPMMAQYETLKSCLPDDAILLFQLGDFYECFNEDAKTAAEILDLTLTKRREAPMAGFPFHTKEKNLQKLVKAGYRVAIAEQIKTTYPAGAAPREVKRIFSAKDFPEEK